MNQNQQSVLFLTSAASDVQCSGGQLTIAGTRSISKSRISGISQVKSKAEVVQKIRFGTDSYTPTVDTVYGVYIGDTNRTRNGSQEKLKFYSVTSLSTLTAMGALAADQREWIHDELVAVINADTKNFVTAASLGSGNGIEITDAAGYYPAFSQTGTGRKGASTVLPAPNEDGTGFSSTYTVQQAAVYSSGLGANLLASVPVIDALYGNLLSGYLSTSLDGISFKTVSGASPVSGQNYDIFVINSLEPQSAHNQRGQLALCPSVVAVAVDNGTGSSTTNLSGFLSFERALRKHVAGLYTGDTNAFVDFFDSPTIFQGAGGAVPTTTGENKIATAYGQFVYNQVGTQTITVPAPGNTGLILDQDLTDTEGAEYTPSLLTVNSQSFIVGKTDFSIVAKVICADHTDADFIVGFRKKAAHAADFNNYTDLAGVGFLADLVYTWGILNNAATVATSTAVAPTDAAYNEFVVNVAASGLVTCKFNGTSYPVYSTGTTALILDAGDEMIPFILYTNNGAGDPDLVLNHVISTSTANWLV